MAINSNQKGKAGEREWVNFLKSQFGIQARRAQQYKGTADSADVDSQWSFIHWEVKRVEKLNLQEAMDRAEAESGVKYPVVAHRKNKKKWLVTMRAEDLLKLSMMIRDSMIADIPID